MSDFVSYQFNSISEDALKALNELSYSATYTRRLCLHKDNNSDLQMMLIDIMPNAEFRMHEHHESDEVSILMRGQIEYLFDNGSRILLDMNGQKSIIIQKNQRHGLKAGPQGAQYIEIIKGPFVKKLKNTFGESEDEE